MTWLTAINLAVCIASIVMAMLAIKRLDEASETYRDALELYDQAQQLRAEAVGMLAQEHPNYPCTRPRDHRYN